MNLLTIQQFAERHSAFTVGGLRWAIFINPNFKRACCRRFGRRLLLNEEAVLKFIDSQQEEEDQKCKKRV